MSRLISTAETREALGGALAAEGRALIGCALEQRHTRHRNSRLARLSLRVRDQAGLARTELLSCKWFLDPAQAERSWAVLTGLWRAGFANGGGLTIPRPRFFFRGLHLAVVQWVPGRPLGEAPRGAERYRQAARWLLKLHAVPQGGQPEAPESPVLQARFARARLALGRDPGLALAAGPLLRAAASTLDRDADGPRCLVHGDFQPANIVVAGAQLAVVDFDDACLAHPAADLGHFIAQLWSADHFRGLPLEAADPLVEAFLEEYRRGLPKGPARGGPPVAAFVARAALEIAAYVLALAPARRGDVEHFLARASRASRGRFPRL